MHFDPSRGNIKLSTMTSAQVSGVLDLTFMEIRESDDFTNAYKVRFAAMTSPSKSTSSATINGNTKANGTSGVAGTLGATGSPTGRRKKVEPIKALRMGNNQIERVENISPAISECLDCSRILWIDVSFNRIISIMAGLEGFVPNLVTLYMHANQVSKISDIKRLTSLEGLKSVSLYGNPVEDHKHYRNYVLYHLKHLTQFDMSPVTKSERQKVSYYAYTLSSAQISPKLFFTLFFLLANGYIFLKFIGGFACVALICGLIGDDLLYGLQMEVWAQTFRRFLNPEEDT